MADDRRLRHQPFAAKPGRRVPIALTADQVEHATADVGLVIEPPPVFDVDRQRAMVAVAPLVVALLRRLAEQPQCDRLHKGIEIDCLSKIHGRL